jgi:hypothetical protein
MALMVFDRAGPFDKLRAGGQAEEGIGAVGADGGLEGGWDWGGGGGGHSR